MSKTIIDNLEASITRIHNMAVTIGIEAGHAGIEAECHNALKIIKAAKSGAIDWPHEVSSILERVPGAVRVREGGGPENLAMSLAVTVANLVRSLPKDSSPKDSLLESRRMLSHALTQWRDAGAHPERVVFAIEDLLKTAAPAPAQLHALTAEQRRESVKAMYDDLVRGGSGD